MIYFYVLTIIPVLIGGILWVLSKKVCWQEWLAGSIAALVVAAIMHLCAYIGQTSDIQTLSGEIVKATHYPQWVEQYLQAHTITHTSGKTSYTTTYYTTEYRTHYEHWDADSNIDTDYDISESKFNDIKTKFNNLTTERVYKGGFYSGDHHVYISYNKSGYVIPITITVSWINKLKAAPTTFSFQKVPKNAPVYNWPISNDPWVSNRLLGKDIQKYISINEWDKMNAKLGPTKHVNVILVAFDSTQPTDLTELQRAKWIGGKKNDLVLIVFLDQTTGKVQSSDVFGWTESEDVKSNLKTILLENKFDNTIIPLIADEIKQHYKMKNWDKSFEYLKISPPTWSYIVAPIVILISQIGYYFWAISNEFDKENN